MKRSNLEQSILDAKRKIHKPEIKKMAVKPINNGIITSNYGWRTSPITQQKEFHKGIDIAVVGNPINTPVLITKPGVVKWLDKTRVYDPDTGKGSFGMVVYVLMDNGWYAIYPHLESIRTDIMIGVKVVEGQQIGVMGNTGLSIGRHLHYQEGKTMGGSGETREPKDIIELYKES